MVGFLRVGELVGWLLAFLLGCYFGLGFLRFFFFFCPKAA